MAENNEFLDANGYIVQDTKVTCKAELLRLLKDWLRLSNQPTIGNVGTYGRRRCVIIALDGGLVAELNSDTKRGAVQEFVKEANANGPDALWSVVLNRRGLLLNKLAFRADGATTPGWYCYLREPLDASDKI
jgi:hypothetical protein